MLDSLRLHGLQLLCPWEFPGNNTGVDCHFLFQGIFPTQRWNLCLLHCRTLLLNLQGSPLIPLCVLVAQSYPTLCNPIDCSPPGSSVHGILQSRILNWVVFSFSRGSSQPRDGTVVSRIEGKFFTICSTKEAQLHAKNQTV